MCNCSHCALLKLQQVNQLVESARLLVGSDAFRIKNQPVDPNDPRRWYGVDWSTPQPSHADAVRKLQEVRKERDALYEKIDRDTKLAFAVDKERCDTIVRLNTENADLRESLAQQNLEFENLMAAYKALLDSQKHLIGALE